jgi:hypothetical protein
MNSDGTNQNVGFSVIAPLQNSKTVGIGTEKIQIKEEYEAQLTISSV